MLTSYRITKYNPLLRNEKGHYTIMEEWTAFSDVGKTVTPEEYYEMENRYVEALNAFMKINNINTLKLKKYELKHEYSEINNHLIDKSIYEKIGNDVIFDITEISTITRVILREYAWGKLEGDRGFFVHFGWDYYMYIGFKPSKNTEKLVANLTIDKSYIENFRSPYLKQLTNNLCN